jgi:ATP-dependent Clp protease ATP-binding subunit ClpC
MFERYTESARRAVFFSRYEAAQNGSPYIETAHLLLGILREGAGFVSSVGGSPVEIIVDDCRKSLAPPSPKVLSGDLPLANGCKRVLAYAFEESMRLQSATIGTHHLILGLLRENDATSEFLKKHGITLEKARSRQPVESFHQKSATPGPAETLIEFFCEGRPLTSASLSSGTPEPRVGEGIVLSNKGTSVFYKVIAVHHYYADIGEHAGSLVYRPIKVVVEVKPDKRKPHKQKPRKRAQSR